MSFPVFVTVFVRKMNCHKISRPDLFSLGLFLSGSLEEVEMRTETDAKRACSHQWLLQWQPVYFQLLILPELRNMLEKRRCSFWVQGHSSIP